MSRPDELYADVVRLLADQPVLSSDLDGVGGGLRRLCAAAAGALSAVGVGLGVVAQNGERVISTGSDPDSEQLEDFQFLLGEGPCVDAVAGRRPVLVPDLDTDRARRWSGFTPAVRGRGIRAVFSFPLQVGAARLGAMDVFRASPGHLSARGLRYALLFAEAAVTTLLDGQENALSGTAGGLDEEVTHQAELFQAQGMVMIQLGVTLAEALTRIRAYTFAENRRLLDVASDIVRGKVLLDP